MGTDGNPDPDRIRRRKDEHIDIVRARHAAGSPGREMGRGTGLDAVVFEHAALPEIDLDEVDLGADFLGRRLRAPLLISSMTGGPSRADTINRHLAEAAQHLGIAFAVGSQRVAIEGGGGGGFSGDLRRLAPDVPLLGNLGAAQLVSGYGLDEARRAVDMIEADALVIHLNPLQEAVQAEGDRRWRGVLAAIEALARKLPVPIVAKEVGAGISGRIARRLVDAGVRVIDVAGCGGTSWAAVEADRMAHGPDRAVALAFAGWGIPTAEAVVSVRRACPDATVIASGGIRDGLDAARAIRLGADLVGQAAGALEAALQSPEAVTGHFDVVIRQLRIACFCTGSVDLAALRRAPLV